MWVPPLPLVLLLLQLQLLLSLRTLAQAQRRHARQGLQMLRVGHVAARHAQIPQAAQVSGQLHQARLRARQLPCEVVQHGSGGVPAHRAQP